MWSPHISACFMSPGITSISNFKKCNERWHQHWRKEQKQKFVLHVHFFLLSFCLTLCSAASARLPVQQTSGLPEPAKHVPDKKTKNKNKTTLFLIRLLHFPTSSQSSCNIALAWSCCFWPYLFCCVWTGARTSHIFLLFHQSARG